MARTASNCGDFKIAEMEVDRQERRALFLRQFSRWGKGWNSRVSSLPSAKRRIWNICASLIGGLLRWIPASIRQTPRMQHAAPGNLPEREREREREFNVPRFSLPDKCLSD